MTQTKTLDIADRIRTIWTHSYPKGPPRTVGNRTRQDWFCSDGERYAMDFTFGGGGSDWYQFDTDQDAWYFGVWVNPVTRQTLTYCEGDICLIDCATTGQYRAELTALAEYHETHARRQYGLDNHDSKHWAKLGD